MKIPGNPYQASVAGLKSTCRLDGDATAATLYYPRHTKLGQRLAQNLASERSVLANYIRQEMGWPRGEGVATRITFVGV
jgi:hypothetical protein